MASKAAIAAKEQSVKELAERIKASKLVLLVEFIGTNVADDTVLRKDLREAGALKTVKKNNIIKRALNANGESGLDEVLVGTSAIALIGVSIALIFTIVPLLREVVYYYYYCRTSIADYFDTQATMLSLNAARLEMAGDPKTASEQRKFIDRFRRISDALSINSKDSVNKAAGDIKKESKEKFKIDDVTDSLPDSAASSLF